jgi:hypothetical protein
MPKCDTAFQHYWLHDVLLYGGDLQNLSKQVREELILLVYDVTTLHPMPGLRAEPLYFSLY